MAEKTITLDASALDQLVEEKVRARIAEKVNPANDSKNEEALYQKQLADAGVVYQIPDRTPFSESLVPCRNEDNGATFKAKVVKSRTFPEGRVIDLLEYRYPDDIDLRCKGLEIRHHKTGQLTVQFKQWRYEEYDKADRKAFIGKSAKRLPAIGEPEPIKFESTAARFGG